MLKATLDTVHSVNVDGLEFYFDSEYMDIGANAEKIGPHNTIIFRPDEYELHERQLLSYVDPNSSVIELGARIGFISCLTNRILNNKHKHVVVEVEDKWKKYLVCNKIKNKCHFKIEFGQMSDTKDLHYIHYPWRRPADLTLEQLQDKYEIVFDALVCDIEGGEYHLPENFFDSMKTIMIELHRPLQKRDSFLISMRKWDLVKSLDTCHVFKR